jgi:hypothetical protein
MKEKKYIDSQKWSRLLIYILLFVDILLVLSLFSFNITVVTKIYLYMLLYSISSALLFMVIVEIFRVKLLTLLELLRYTKKPRIFEFGFFFFSFLATFFTIFSSGLYNNPELFLNYLEKTWYFMSFYGIAFASGWYHYVLRIDY